MSVLVVGSAEPIGALTSALSERGVEAEALRLGSNNPSGESLASALVELERTVIERGPAVIVALGPGDAATAAALVANKAGIRLLSLLDRSEGPGSETWAVAMLSSERFAFPQAGPDVARAAEEIAAILDGPVGAP